MTKETLLNTVNGCLSNIVDEINEQINDKFEEIMAILSTNRKDTLGQALGSILFQSEKHQELLEYLNKNNYWQTNIKRFEGQQNYGELITRSIENAIGTDFDNQNPVKPMFKVSKEIVFKYFEDLYDFFQASEIEFEIKAELFGIIIEDNIVINDYICFAPMSLEEIERRDDFVGKYSLSQGIEKHRKNNADIIIKVKYRITHDDNSLQKKWENSSEKYKGDFENILFALYLTIPGAYDIGARMFEHPYFNRKCMYSYDLVLKTTYHIISKEDISRFKSIFILLNNYYRFDDENLNLALWRFYYGTRRLRYVDKIVDYCIAWETILLTSNGKSTSNKLSHRFSENGASLLYLSEICKDKEKTFNIMKVFYSIRSCIVHGNNDKKILKELKKINCDDISSLVVIIEQYLRQVIIWLLKTEKDKRPYIKKNVWKEWKDALFRTNDISSPENDL